MGDAGARGIICGLSGATDKWTVVRAGCESMAYQSYDVLRAMERDSGITIESLSVDGGATANGFIMQFQADILGIPVLRSSSVELTALGAAHLDGLAVGYWEDREELLHNQKWSSEGFEAFEPKAEPADVERWLAGWHEAVGRARSK